nr:hypothetical protein KitaXyl93_35930 [Kitasatospora sp. Xyl93]
MLGQVPNRREKPNSLDLPKQVLYVVSVAPSETGVTQRGLLWAALSCTNSPCGMGRKLPRQVAQAEAEDAAISAKARGQGSGKVRP